jgi:murein DD-endopeptidase MepM/ murein hydrolase activator NlpD
MTHFLQRSALILLGTTALVACTTTGEPLKPTYPSRSAEAPPPMVDVPAPPPPPVETPPQSPPPSVSVESHALAPLTPAQPRPEAPRAETPPPAAATRPPPPAPTFQTVTRRTVTGKVVEVEGKPVTYEVKKGDTLEKIARKLDTTVDDLKHDNKLKTSSIHPGDTLKGPSADAKAYVVGQGDTIFSIAKRFSVSVDALRDENEMSSRASIHSGQKLRLPQGSRDKGPITVSERVATGSSAAVEAPEPEETAPAPRRGRPGRDVAPAEAAPEVQSVSRRTVTGRVIEVEGKAIVYTVKKGDNLSKVARKLDTTVDDLKSDNRLKSVDLHAGQKLKGPHQDAKAYVAGEDDTLAAIGKRFGVSAEALRAENGLSRRANIRAGQKIRLPDGYRDHGPIVTRVAAPASHEPAYTPPAREERQPALPSAPQPYVPSRSTPYAPPRPTGTYTPPASTGGGPAVAPTQSAPLSDAQISQMGQGLFIWPLKGDILSPFGPKAGGQKNDGINIRADSGTAVRSAADGSVVYAGDQVPGFGNLVLIQHAGGWVTAYGHLSRVDVKGKQQISQGQQIGLSGSTGGVPEPQLHFEVRYAPSPKDRAQPIDPKLVLPK